MARLGGKARATSLTPERRKKIAQKAAKASALVRKKKAQKKTKA